MNAPLIEAFQQQCVCFEQQIAALTQELNALKDGEESAFMRERIDGLKKLLEVTRLAQTTIIAGEGEAEAAAKRFGEWRALVREIREKSATFDKIAIQIPALVEEVTTGRALVSNAQDELALHLARQPGALALQKEIEAHTQKAARLKSAIESLIAALKAAGERETAIRAEALRQRDALMRLSWQENRLRPASLQRRGDGSGIFRTGVLGEADAPRLV